MGRVMTIYCDSCNKELKRPYQTMTVRRYTSNGATVRLETIWMCDKCYNRMVRELMLPPFKEEGEE